MASLECSPGHESQAREAVGGATMGRRFRRFQEIRKHPSETSQAGAYEHSPIGWQMRKFRVEQGDGGTSKGARCKMSGAIGHDQPLGGNGSWPWLSLPEIRPFRLWITNSEC